MLIPLFSVKILPQIQCAMNYLKLIDEAKQCTIGAEHLPQGPRPVFQVHPAARILIAGQAPGSKVHASAVPFDDASGERLREWMGINTSQFYNEQLIAILPLGFCYPGRGKSGDLPPRKECAPAWREKMLNVMPNISLTLLIGSSAIDWHLGPHKHKTLTETVRNWQEYAPKFLPLPHPSPRNNIWLKKNAWFASDVLPQLRRSVAAELK